LPSEEPSKNLRKFDEGIDRAKRLSTKSLKNSLCNLFGKCPVCRDRGYKELFGGKYDKYCINCGTAYN